MRLRTFGRYWRTVRGVGFDRALLRSLRGPRRRVRAWIAAGRGSRGPATFRTVSLEPRTGLTGEWTPPSTFRFLGVERDLGPGWDDASAPSALWAYHSHYLDSLADGSFDRESRLDLLRRWIGGNPTASGRGWDPFPTAMRIVNSLEFLVSERLEDADLAESLAMQTWWLSGLFEWDLGGNHLMKDALALCWAGRLLECRGSDRWKAEGDARLTDAIERQFLADGFHYERTPAYHAIATEDLFRLHRLLVASGERTTPFGERVQGALSRAAASLASALHVDGEIPLFNDAALGQGPEVARLLPAIRAAGIDFASDPRGAPEAGFLRLDSGESTVIFDAGEIGAPDQPGHAHADSLSFEMSGWGRRILVDGGVFDYEAGPERRYARSTPAHNTVTVDGEDSSEVWSVFRVGRRARPRAVSTGGTAGRPWAVAEHDGYRFLPGRPIHRRRIEAEGSGAWHVSDVVSGGGTHEAVSRLRLEPSFKIVEATARKVRARSGPVEIAISRADGPLSVGEGEYYPRFGERKRIRVIEARAEGRLPLRVDQAIRLSRND